MTNPPHDAPVPEDAGPQAGPSPDPAPQPEPEPTAPPTDSSADPQPGMATHAQPEAEPGAATTPEPDALPEPGTATQPQAETAQPQAEPSPVPTPQPEPGATGPEVEPFADSQAETAQPQAVPYVAAQPEPGAAAQPSPGHQTAGQFDEPEPTPLLGTPVQAAASTGPVGEPPHTPLNWAQQPQGDPVTAPVPVIRSHDPLAAAIGNASLLGIGYLLLRRPVLAVLSVLVTIVLVVLLAASVRTVGFEFVVVAWWLALIAHGWFLAGRRAHRVTVGRHRVVALAVTIPVLLVVALLRWDAASIDQDVADARAAGDCPAALTALDDVWFGHHVVDAPMTVRGEHTTEACARLSTAQLTLGDGLATGEPTRLTNGFDQLHGVLTDLPGHERLVTTVLDKFLGGLPTTDPCRTALITDWLGMRPATHDELDRSTAVIAKVAPDALVDCGDQLMKAGNWELARTRYHQLLDQFPASPLAPRATAGAKKATLAIELDLVKTRISDGTYCENPAKYSAAPSYHKGGNRAVFLGQPDYSNRLPSGWRTADPRKAAIVACLGGIDNGPVVQTCFYRVRSTGIAGNVTFHQIAIPVRAYALRTGHQVVSATIKISGSACPAHFFARAPGGAPPPDQYVSPSNGNVRAAFKFLVVR